MKAYIDSCIWINLIEGTFDNRKIINNKLKELYLKGYDFYISELVKFEVLIKHYKEKNTKLIEIYSQIFRFAKILKNYINLLKDAFNKK